MHNQLITNNGSLNFLQELQNSLHRCESFDFTVAFVSMSGLQLLLDTFQTLKSRNVSGRIITSTYLNFTEPKAVRRLMEFENIELRLFVTEGQLGFHTKGYIFRNSSESRVIIGSANLTQNALKVNKEMNVRVLTREENPFIESVSNEFESLWQSSQEVDDLLLTRYEEHYTQARTGRSKAVSFEITNDLRPNQMQELALANFRRLRAQQQQKALAIAATGSGKTVMAALDIRSLRPKRVLFIVHREQILRTAKVVFSKIIPERSSSMGLLTGNIKEPDKDFIFSTNLTMSRSLEYFKSDHFDYIVIDEAHHATSDSWRSIINHFSPKFLVGMTATPERSDGGDIFEFFGNNIAIELRLRGALEQDVVAPFHYFGISDETVDLHDVDLRDVDKIAARMKINRRVDFVIEKMRFYGHDGAKLKALGFCVTQDHAAFMAEEFNKRNIAAVALNSNDSIDYRLKCVTRLESENDNLQVIFAVDIFNEGVDIPSINTILMLRPTNSPIIFVQQLGRGLRKTDSKQYLTVIDFIGNHSKTFLIAIALCGARAYDKDSLKRAVETDFSDIPGCTNIQLDRISKDRILNQIEQTNFNSLRFLKEEYLEFKNLNGNKIPTLLDYIKFDGAPDPLKFVWYSGSYDEFLAKVDESAKDKQSELLTNPNFLKLTRQLFSELPLKRPHEFAILESLLLDDNVGHAAARAAVSKYTSDPDDETITHSFNFISGAYDDRVDAARKLKLVQPGVGVLNRGETLQALLDNTSIKSKIAEIIRYGLLRYEEEFGNTNYGLPFLKLYQTYNGRSIALVSNYNKAHSSFRGQGVLSCSNDRFLIIDLHKDENLEERINYKDKFTSPSTFQWQSPNNTRQDSNSGKDLVFSRERGVRLHLFVRKFKIIDGVTQPFIYIGKVERYGEPEGERPITIQFKLRNEVPQSLYEELTSA